MENGRCGREWEESVDVLNPLNPIAACWTGILARRVGKTA